MEALAVAIFIVGVAVGVVVTRLWLAAEAQWKKARGMLGAPDKARDESKQKVKKAREDAAKARRDMVNAAFRYALVVTVLVAALVAIFFLL